MQAFLDPYLSACRLPYRRVEKNVTTWRGHGLSVVATHGVPFRYDRLFYIWAATMAASRGRAFSFNPEELPEMFGVPWSRKEVQECLHRASGCHIEALRQCDEYVRMFRCYPVEWLESKGDLWSIRLGSQFQTGTLIPVSLDVIRGCVRENSVAALALYLWQMREARQHTVPAHVPVFGYGGVLSQIGSETREERKAKQQIRAWQGLITALWPSCPHILSANSNELILHPMEVV